SNNGYAADGAHPGAHAHRQHRDATAGSSKRPSGPERATTAPSPGTPGSDNQIVAAGTPAWVASTTIPTMPPEPATARATRSSLEERDTAASPGRLQPTAPTAPSNTPAIASSARWRRFIGFCMLRTQSGPHPSG